MSEYQGSTSFASNPLGISSVSVKRPNGSPHRLYSKNLAVVQQHCMYEIATRPNIAEELQFLNLPQSKWREWPTAQSSSEGSVLSTLQPRSKTHALYEQATSHSYH